MTEAIEIIIYTDPFERQHRLPHVAQLALQCGLRFRVGATAHRTRASGSGKALRSTFPLRFSGRESNEM